VRRWRAPCPRGRPDAGEQARRCDDAASFTIYGPCCAIFVARAGLVAVHPLGHRRVYSIETSPLKDFGQRVRELIAIAEAHEDELDVLTRYQAAIEAETALADRDRWADGRGFRFERVLAATPDLVWQHWIEPDLLASWWAPPPLTVTQAVLGPEAHGRAILEIRDAEVRYRSEGQVTAAGSPEHLAFDLTVLDAHGAASFTSHHELRLLPVPEGTRLRLEIRISDTTVAAAPFIAGIEAGWGQAGPRQPRRPPRRVPPPRRPDRRQRRGWKIMTHSGERLVIANINITLDGR
jgi:uncharacterized protein YndB with AHSA1/START domain